MARIPLLTDLSELGNVASLTAGGWSASASPGSQYSVVTTPRFTDLLGGGGAYAHKLRHESTPATFYFKSPTFTATSTFRLRFHHYFTGYEGTYIVWVAAWYKDSTQLGGIRINPSTQKLELYSGTSTLLATSVNTLLLATWYTIEIGVTIGNSAAYEVRVNGTATNWISGTGDTQPGADTDINNFLFASGAHGSPNNANGVDYSYDDFVGDDANWIGESVISILSPNGAGNTTQLTPSAGSNYQNVDEIPPSDSDYNSTDTTGEKDTYALPSLPGSATTVKAVTLVARVARVGEDISNAKLVTRSGGTDYDSGAFGLSTTPEIIRQVRETDPATAAAWTVSGVNAMEIGIKFET